MTTVTLELDDDVMEAIRNATARSGRPSEDIVSDAIRRYVGPSVLDRLWARNHMDEDEAMQLALDEIKAMREERRRGSV